MKSLQRLFWASFHSESPRRRKADPFVDREGRVYAWRQTVCSPSLPTRSSQWSPLLMKLQRSAAILKALPTYAAATPLHTHSASWWLMTPQTAADKEIRFRSRAKKREKEKRWRRKTAGTWINQRGWRKSDENVHGAGGWERQKRILTPTCRTWVQTQALSWH